MFKFGSAKLAEENRKIDKNERDHLDVTGIINLSAPVTTVENNIAMVIATKGSLNDKANDLAVTFDPVYVNFGNGGQFKIDLSDPTWNCNTGNKDCSLTILGNGRTRDQSVTNGITATFTLTQLETLFTAEDTGEILAAVPEPGMIALMGLGLAGLGYSRRKQA